MAFNLIKICKELGFSVPGEIAILGVDNDPLLCDFSNPTISSIDPNPFEIGYEAAKTLSMWIDRTSHKPKDVKPAPIGLTERNSTQVFPFPEPWLSDALVYIRRNVSRNLNASEVISMLKLSHTTVEKTFRKRLGTSIRQEIANIRIEEAKRLLEKTSVSLAEVASLSGFSSKSYFTAAFNQATGTTPLKWRMEKQSS
ncbi:MAG: helix-turn-helix domain-containing protein [Kiritimatiellae bacterium]|nr:helix-turn-helix domain-containing protein [Kiritimatiellia bacterium]